MHLAVGITLIPAAGGPDLSIGSNVVLSKVVGAKVMVALWGTPDEVRAAQYPDLAPGVARGRGRRRLPVRV